MTRAPVAAGRNISIAVEDNKKALRWAANGCQKIKVVILWLNWITSESN